MVCLSFPSCKMGVVFTCYSTFYCKSNSAGLLVLLGLSELIPITRLEQCPARSSDRVARSSDRVLLH